MLVQALAEQTMSKVTTQGSEKGKAEFGSVSKETDTNGEQTVTDWGKTK